MFRVQRPGLLKLPGCRLILSHEEVHEAKLHTCSHVSRTELQKPFKGRNGDLWICIEALREAPKLGRVGDLGKCSQHLLLRPWLVRFQAPLSEFFELTEGVAHGLSLHGGMNAVLRVMVPSAYLNQRRVRLTGVPTASFTWRVPSKTAPEATVPVLSLSASGALGMESVAVPVGRVATMMGSGTGAAIILHESGMPGTGGPGQMRPSAEELLQQSTQRPPERLSGFRIFGNKGLVGSTFQRNILLIEAEAKGAAPLRRLISEFEAEARAAGASRLSITGHAVINQGFLSPALAERFGFQLRRINKDTIELVKELTR